MEKMRYLFLCLFFFTFTSLGAGAAPLQFEPEAKAQGFSFDLGDQWTAVKNGLSVKLDPKYSGPDYPESVSGLATHDYDAAKFVETAKMVQKMQGKSDLEEVQLGQLPALLKREKSSFTVYSGHGTTKITIHYKDGRDASNRTPYDDILQSVLKSFKITR